VAKSERAFVPSIETGKKCHEWLFGSGLYLLRCNRK
jgi:hypothetical protein